MTNNDNPEAKTTKNVLKLKYLVLLLNEIEANGDHIRLISKNLKRSPQNLNHYYRKLLSIGFIRKRQSHPFAIYELTALGKRIKENLGQSDGAKTIWRCHALIVGFEIKDFGSFDWSRYQKKYMNNWEYAEETVKDSIGEWKVHIQTTDLLKIYCPSVYTDNPEKSFGNLYDVASRLARTFEESYKMKLGLMKIIREGHKELVGSERLAKLFGRTRIEKVWVDASTGSNRLEESQSENRLEKVLEVPRLMEFIIEQQKKFAENLDKHLSVLGEMSETLKAIREELKGR